MGTTKYTAIVGLMFATVLIAWAGSVPSAQDRYEAWRAESGLGADDRNHFYLSASLMAIENGQATIRVGVAGEMQGYTLNVAEGISAGPSGGYIPVGDGRTLANPFSGFADLTVTLPVHGVGSAMMVTLQPAGSFDDARSLRIYLPMQPRPDALVQSAALEAARTVSCPKGCFLFSYSFPPPCAAGTQYICCKTARFDVDGTRCTISCLNRDPCPVIISDTVITDTAIGTIK